MPILYDVGGKIVAALVTAGLTWFFVKRSIENRRKKAANAVFEFLFPTIMDALRTYGRWLQIIGTQLEVRPQGMALDQIPIFAFYSLTKARPGLADLVEVKAKLQTINGQIISASSLFYSKVGDLLDMLSEIEFFEQHIGTVIDMCANRRPRRDKAGSVPDLASLWNKARALREEKPDRGARVNEAFLIRLTDRSIDTSTVLLKKENHELMIDVFRRAIEDFNKGAVAATQIASGNTPSVSKEGIDDSSLEMVWTDFGLAFLIGSSDNEENAKQRQEALLPILAAIKDETETEWTKHPLYREWMRSGKFLMPEATLKIEQERERQFRERHPELYRK